MRFDWIWDQKLSNTVLMYLRTKKDFLFEIKKTKKRTETENRKTNITMVEARIEDNLQGEVYLQDQPDQNDEQV